MDGLVLVRAPSGSNGYSIRQGLTGDSQHNL
jgi:hypothetical protein